MLFIGEPVASASNAVVASTSHPNRMNNILHKLRKKGVVKSNTSTITEPGLSVSLPA